jgi:hypothetical protein
VRSLQGVPGRGAAVSRVGGGEGVSEAAVGGRGKKRKRMSVVPVGSDASVMRVFLMCD